MGRIILFISLIGISITALWQGFGMKKDYDAENLKYDSLAKEEQALETENSSLLEKKDYLSRPENLIKEAKAKFNYRLPQERVIIVAPKDNR